jgi:hypothetical protein
MIFITQEFVLKIEKPGKNLLGNISNWFKQVNLPGKTYTRAKSIPAPAADDV